MGSQNFNLRLNEELEAIRAAGLFKEERVITGPQEASIPVGGEAVLNFCANNYLGLSNAPELLAGAKDGLDRFGFGMSSVRFICGTQTLHKDLEAKIADFLGFEDAILYSSCFDANAGLFETLLGPEDVIISDQLNHASIIDGVRLCKAQRARYPNSDMAALEAALKEHANARTRLITTDGVFSMDGLVAPLQQICDLAERYDAIVHVDDSHATGFFGPTGRGSIDHCGVMGRVDIVTSTFGKALGGASGGFTAASAEVVAMLRQRSRPYLFSNSLAPPIASATVAALELLDGNPERLQHLQGLTVRFREEMTSAGFDIVESDHPIVPVMLGEARLAAELADDLLEEGIYVIGFSFPVVPRGQARIRVQLSAAHSDEDLDRAIAAFIKCGRARGVIN
ncbi:MAG: glycine C-acetyltransferase [Myxococcales bacterium]|jgi:glycine C-acetyltransferase|nr:glycine C-acetyltransferase [Myxococcales bacterium]